MLVIITARKNSKRMPHKNDLLFNGDFNIVELAIGLAHALGGKVVLATDYDPDDLTHNPMLWENVLVMERPPEICQDRTPSEDVVAWVLKEFPEETRFCLMQPTSPLMSLKTLITAKMYFENLERPSSLISVNPAYQPNGAFYFCTVRDFEKYGTWWTPDTWLYVCDWLESFDINMPYEFAIAQALYGRRILGNEAEQ